MLMLELVTLDKFRFYYNAERTGLKMDRVAFDIASMSAHYSDGFIQLVRACLTANPQERYSLQEAFDSLGVVKKGLKSVTHCVRLQEDDCKSRKAGKREGMSAKGEHFLKGLQKKLTPSPISTMTSSSHTSSHLSNLTLAGKTQSSIR
jgi:hypothetical protein